MWPPDRADAVLALALPAPDLELVVDPGAVLLSPHAVLRYRERVEGLPHRLVVRRIRSLLAAAQWRTRPRSWTDVVLHPEVIYGYSPDQPDVCLLLRGRVLVTVLSRRFLRQANRCPGVEVRAKPGRISTARSVERSSCESGRKESHVRPSNWEGRVFVCRVFERQVPARVGAA